MRRLANALSFACLITLPGCLLTRTEYSVPPGVQAGQVFEITVGATYPYTSSPMDACCVLQVPNGFTALAAASSSGFVAQRDDPMILAAYAAEPGHYLACWSGQSLQSQGLTRLKIFVQAPITPGAHMFKVSLARRWLTTVQAMDPPNVTAFASIGGGAALPCAVSAAPTTEFANAAPGLPIGAGGWTSLCVGDLDGDGVTDLGATTTNGQGPTCFRASPGGWLPYGAPAPSIQGGRIAFGNFDGDGLLDMIDADGHTWFGTGSGFVAGPSLPPPLLVDNNAVAAGDIDGDGFDDIAIAVRAGPASLSLFRSVGNRTFTTLPNAPTAPVANIGPLQQLLLQDVTDDGFCDLLWVNEQAMRLWTGNGGLTWTASSSGLPPNAIAATAADLDDNGSTELLFGRLSSSTSGELQILQRVGSSWSPVFTVPWLATSVATLDFDRDGRLDIAVCLGALNGTAPYRLELLRQNPIGGWSFVSVPNTGLSQTCMGDARQLAVGDFNDDTFPDLAAAIPNEGLIVYMNQRGGLSRYGAGCGLPNFVLGGNGAPSLGSTTFALQLQGGAPNAPAFLWLGDGRRNWNGVALPFDLGLLGAPGCALLAEPDAIAALPLDANGAVAVPLPIPSTLPIRATFFGQAACVAPAANPLGLGFSHGLAIRLL